MSNPDESVESHTGRAGSAFMRGNYLYARRISNNSSILEIELCHKKSSYPCTAFTQQSVYILTDSSAMHSLQKLPPDDNFHLITSALLKLQQLDQGKSVHMWMMCHGVKDSLRLAQVCISHIKHKSYKEASKESFFPCPTPGVGSSWFPLYCMVQGSH